ncbi:hypothetical protein GJAV_G00141030 [Gymnothorax javanicus]|nr:hypothetical protein GJAV_G00141030 [Gymnothorax javanicus]
MQAAWNMWRLYEMLATPEATVEFCQKRGLLASDPVCKRCRKALTWKLQGKASEDEPTAAKKRSSKTITKLGQMRELHFCTPLSSPDEVLDTAIGPKDRNY